VDITITKAIERLRYMELVRLRRLSRDLGPAEFDRLRSEAAGIAAAAADLEEFGTAEPGVMVNISRLEVEGKDPDRFVTAFREATDRAAAEERLAGSDVIDAAAKALRDRPEGVYRLKRKPGKVVGLADFLPVRRARPRRAPKAGKPGRARRSR